MASLSSLDMNRRWETSTAGKLAQAEFPYQRMHREPTTTLPADQPQDPYRTVHRTAFAPSGEKPGSVGARYTVGTSNDLGTHSVHRQVSLNELKVGRVHLGDGGSSWSTNFKDAFSVPNQAHPAQGAHVPRCGKAPRMPISEVERRFGSLDSQGTMPGTEGVRESSTETKRSFAAPGPPAKVDPHITLGFSNDIGTSTRYQKAPAFLADMTHYTLGEVPRAYVTTAMDATRAPPPPPERVHQSAAGESAPTGPSQVEQGFRQQYNSQHYNIINGGTRLHGELNADSYLAKRNAAAHERPVGRKQHPNVDPALRGVSGIRQSFDIITGEPRPRERW